MGLEEHAGQFQAVLDRFFSVLIVTIVKVGLVICGFELAGLNDSS